MRTTFTSESVTEGHPDKMADQISDAVLDAMLEGDPASRVACETLLTTGLVVVAGEVTTSTYVDIPALVRDTVCDIGYDNDAYGFNGKTCGVLVSLDAQSPDIAQGVDAAFELRSGKGGEDVLNAQGAGDQGMMFGYACDETPDLMPLPIWLAHRLSERLAQVRRAAAVPYLRPDGKTQVSVVYEDGRPVRIDTVLISTQHAGGIDLEEQLRPDLIEHVINPLLPTDLDTEGLRIFVNPTGIFELGGPHADTGLTGRKIIVDTYGGMARHGGGAFSGQGPLEGRPLGGLRGALGGQARRGRRRRQALRGAGGLRHRRRPSGLAARRDVRHRDGRPREDRRLRCASCSTCARPPSAATSTCAARSTRRRRPTATSVARRRSSRGRPPRGWTTCGPPWDSERAIAPLRGAVVRWQ